LAATATWTSAAWTASVEPSARRAASERESKRLDVIALFIDGIARV
jgi:hypothetical protein